MDMRTKLDYREIRYWITPDNEIFSGPYAPQDNLHFMEVGSNTLSHSDVPEHAVEVKPWQVARILKLRADGKQA